MRSFLRKNLLFLFFLFTLFALLQAKTEVKIIKSAADLPEKFSNLWKEGDYLILSEKSLGLIGGVSRTLAAPSLNTPTGHALGSILGFIPAGRETSSDLCIGAPVLRMRKRTTYLSYSSVEQKKEKTKEGLIFEALARFESKRNEKADIKTIYSIYPEKGRIEISSTITNTGQTAFQDLSYSLYFNAFHSYYFSPFSVEKYRRLNFRIYQKKGHYLAWINLNPPIGKSPQPNKLAPGESFEIHYLLLIDCDETELLENVYKTLGVESYKAQINLWNPNGGEMEVVVKDAFSPAIFFRSFLDQPDSLTIPLPRGVYLVQANFFPAVSEEFLEVGPSSKKVCRLQAPPLGKIRVKIRNSQGVHVPGKVTFIGLFPTRNPYFLPENPLETGRSWERFKNSVFPEEEGKEVILPAGTYLVSASRGPEYTLDQKVIEVLKDEPQDLIFTIDRVLEPKNLISFDPHLHTINSDGSMGIAERLRSLVAEGLDTAVASDHNFITDYLPILKKMGLSDYLAVLCGNEVTTSDIIHFNTYPLIPDPKESNNGAIYALAESAGPLFKTNREKNPQAIIQVNHPRAGDLGYFNNFSLDPESAAFASRDFDLSFDLLEVMNGAVFFDSNNKAIEDWFHLLNRGYFFPIVGSSDSHTIDRGEPGYSRTYISYEGQKGENVDWNALLQALKKGRTFVTNGPLVEFKVNRLYTWGDHLSAPEGKVELWIRVQSSPWIAVDEVRVVINGERKVILPVKAAEKDLEKFNDQVTLTLKKDSYIIVETLGKKTLFPVLQQPSSKGSFLGAAFPYALTNPVFVDVDGNGKFDPPLPEKVKIFKESSK